MCFYSLLLLVPAAAESSDEEEDDFVDVPAKEGLEDFAVPDVELDQGMYGLYCTVRMTLLVHCAIE